MNDVLGCLKSIAINLSIMVMDKCTGSTKVAVRGKSSNCVKHPLGGVRGPKLVSVDYIQLVV